MKIYIAGPITGHELTFKEAFNSATVELVDKYDAVVLNPSILPAGLSEFEYMDICCAMLRCSDSIYMLKGYGKSDGARAEIALARKLGLKILFQK